MAIETTRRRFASTISCLASRSPRSMRFASATSRSAVSSSTLPIERRYRRSESRLGSTVRSISGLRGASGSLSASRTAGSNRRAFGGRRLAVGPDDVDALAFEEGVELDDLLLRDLDLLQAGGDLLEGQETAFLAFGDERTQLVDLRDRRLALEQCFGLSAQPLDPSRWSSSERPRLPEAFAAPSYPSVALPMRHCDCRRSGRVTPNGVSSVPLARFVAPETKSV